MSVRFFDFLRLLGRSTDATGSEGDLWYRTDLDQVHASDGTGSIPIGPDGNVPVIRSTGWHNLPSFGATSTLNLPDGRLFALPFWPGRSTTLTGVSANVTLALVGGNLRMGLYAAGSDTLPGTLVADYGTVGAGILGIRSITGLSTSVRPVLHYLVMARQGGVATLTVSSRDTWDPMVSETGTALIAANNNAYFRDTVTGALPASFGAVTGTIQGPSLAVQLT